MYDQSPTYTLFSSCHNTLLTLYSDWKVVTRPESLRLRALHTGPSRAKTRPGVGVRMRPLPPLPFMATSSEPKKLFWTYRCLQVIFRGFGAQNSIA